MGSDPTCIQARRPCFVPALIPAFSVFLLLIVAMGIAPGQQSSAFADGPPALPEQPATGQQPLDSVDGPSSIVGSRS
ncbi:MAG: hypothetical protein ACK2U9_21410 [Anaerolineae bacterium]